MKGEQFAAPCCPSTFSLGNTRGWLMRELASNFDVLSQFFSSHASVAPSNGDSMDADLSFSLFFQCRNVFSTNPMSFCARPVLLSLWDVF